MLKQDPRPDVAFGNIWGCLTVVTFVIQNCLPSRYPSPPPPLFPCEVRESNEASPYLPSDYKDQTTKMKENRKECENLRIYLHGC